MSYGHDLKRSHLPGCHPRPPPLAPLNWTQDVEIYMRKVRVTGGLRAIGTSPEYARRNGQEREHVKGYD